MGYHHLALACKDMEAIHNFYEDVMGFELVKVEIGPVKEGGWAKHYFYRVEDDSKFIAFWEMHDVPGGDTVEIPLPVDAIARSDARHVRAVSTIVKVNGHLLLAQINVQRAGQRGDLLLLLLAGELKGVILEVVVL